MSILSSVGSAISSAVSGIANAFSSGITGLSGLTASQQQAVSNVQAAFGNAVGSIGGAFQSVAAPVQADIASAINSALNGFQSNILKPVLDNIGGGIDKLIADAQKIPNEVISSLQPTFTGVVDTLDNLSTGIASGFSSTVSGIESSLGSVGKAVISDVTSGIGQLGTLFTQGIGAVQNDIGGVLQELQGEFSRIEQSTVGAVRAVADEIAPLVGNVAGALANLPVDFGLLLDKLSASIEKAATIPRTPPPRADLDLTSVFAALAHIIAE